MRSSHPSLRRFASKRFSAHPRAARVLAAGTLAGAIGSPFISSPFIARADEAPNATVAQMSNLRLAQIVTAPQNGNGPRVSIVQPSYSDLVRGDTNVVIAVESLGAPTKSVELFVDGVSATNGAIAFSSLPSAQFNWKTGQFKDGAHQLSVRVTDINGFIGQADTQVYVNNSRALDKTAPKLQWMNVHSGDLLHGQADLQLQASDDFGVKYIVITVNSISSPDRMPPLRASLINRAPYVYPLDTARLPDGVYVLNARGYDVLQNAGETKQITFGVSNNGLNPTVIERLDAVLDKHKNDATVAPKSNANSADGMKAQTRHEARVAPTRVSSTPIAPTQKTPSRLLTNATPIATAAKATLTSPKVMAPKVALPKVVAKIVAPAKIKLAVSPSVAPTRLAAIKTAPKSSVAAPHSRVAITKAAPGESANLILPSPSLTVAILRSVATPRSIETAVTVAENVENAVPSKISLPETKSSTRLAQLVKPETVAETVKTKISSVDTEAVLSAAPSVPSAARIANVLSSPALASNDQASPTRFARAEISAQPRRATQNVDLSTEVVAPRDVQAESAQAARVEARKTDVRFASADVAVENIETKPVLTVASTVAPTAQISVAAPQIALRETVQTPRFAMLQEARGARNPHAIERSETAFETTSNVAAQAIRTSEDNVQIRLTAAVVEAPDSRITRREILVAQPMTRRSEALHLISLPSTLATPSKGGSSTRNGALSGENGTPRANGTSRANAAITMSPVTLAALGARGAAGTLPATHIVARGESLRTVAERYGLPLRTLANVNNLSEKAILPIGSRLNLPRALNFRFGNQNQTGDIGAIMVGQTSVAPFRFLFEQQGGTIRWDDAHQRITAVNGAQQVTLSIGSREATVNDRKVMMDMAAFLLSGRTMVPMRFFEKALQAQVDWEPSTGRIYISMANNG